MKIQTAVTLAALALGGAALAGEDKHKKQLEPADAQTRVDSEAQMKEGTGGSGMPDMSKTGPWTRKPADEGKIKKEVKAFFKEEESLMKKRDFQALVNRVDFPVYMVTDNKKGETHAMINSREDYVKMMQPMYENAPKDEQYTNDPEITVLSDAMAVVTNNFTLRTGGKTYKGKSASLLIKDDGQWKWKMMAEPGWGDMPMEGVGGSGSEGEGDQELKKEEHRDGTGGSGSAGEEEQEVEEHQESDYRK